MTTAEAVEALIAHVRREGGISAAGQDDRGLEGVGSGVALRLEGALFVVETESWHSYGAIRVAEDLLRRTRTEDGLRALLGADRYLLESLLAAARCPLPTDARAPLGRVETPGEAPGGAPGRASLSEPADAYEVVALALARVEQGHVLLDSGEESEGGETHGHDHALRGENGRLTLVNRRWRARGGVRYEIDEEQRVGGASGLRSALSSQGQLAWLRRAVGRS